MAAADLPTWKAVVKSKATYSSTADPAGQAVFRHTPCFAVDVPTCTGCQWLCGPYGTGFCWVRPGLLSELRTGTRYWLPAARAQGLEHLDAVVDADWPRDARAHAVFCTASFFNLLPWIGSLTYLADLGIERIWAHNQAMLAALSRVFADSGYRVLRRKRASPLSWSSRMAPTRPGWRNDLRRRPGPFLPGALLIVVSRTIR